MPARVIGRMVWESNSSPEMIVREHLGVKILYFTFRRAEENTIIKNGGSGRQVNNWHRDGLNNHPHLLVWSNRESTEVLLPDGTELQFEPYDVVFIDNIVCKHRVPARVSPDRLFWRVSSVSEDVKWLP